MNEASDSFSLFHENILFHPLIIIDKYWRFARWNARHTQKNTNRMKNFILSEQHKKKYTDRNSCMMGQKQLNKGRKKNSRIRRRGIQIYDANKDDTIRSLDENPCSTTKRQNKWQQYRLLNGKRKNLKWKIKCLLKVFARPHPKMCSIEVVLTLRSVSNWNRVIIALELLIFSIQVMRYPLSRVKNKTLARISDDFFWLQ